MECGVIYYFVAWPKSLLTAIAFSLFSFGRLDSFMIFLILSKCCFFSLKNGNAGKTATLYKCTAVYYMNE